jgi:putative SOS response-associated peptidase YedK
MCGRFTIAFVIGLCERFKVKNCSIQLMPRYNIAPSQDVPVVTRAQNCGSENEIRMMMWGLVPSWSKDPAHSPKPINARGDTLDQKPMFRDLLKSQRCLVPATGFYEWKKESRGKKPYYVRMKDNSIFSFAGLYDQYRASDGQQVATFTIITTEPNEVVSPLHDRMPAILKREDEEIWLQSCILYRDQVVEILQPYPASQMIAYPVSKAVNTPDNDRAELIRPVGFSDV